MKLINKKMMNPNLIGYQYLLLFVDSDLIYILIFLST